LIKQEEKRQQETLMLIPSENIASRAVEEAVASIFGNKYAEGYPFKRYYQGQQYVDQLETLVIERTKKLFRVPHANVQPYSGSPANLAVLLALAKPGDSIMGLSLDSGGHLTHGSKASYTGKLFHSVQYGVNKQGLIDYDDVFKLAKKVKPKVIIAGITAYPRVLDWKKFAQIADEVEAYLMADIAHLAGLVIAGAYPSPAPFTHVVTTTTHKTLRGPRGALIMVTERGLKKDPDLQEKIDKSVFPGLQGGPHENTIAGIGIALKEVSQNSFRVYAKQIVKNARALASQLNSYGFDLVSGGTDSHLILINLQNKNLLGNTVAEACEEAGMVLNRNAIPNDPNPPYYPSGIRLGTPGVTSRGMKEKEMKHIAQCINDVVVTLQDIKKKTKMTMLDERKRENRIKIIKQAKTLRKVRQRVLQLCTKFPIKKYY
ncbi:serine hydroxymethyltransferase, partial [Candidatus Roizmanbacteria bacterium]|nr:serine hydroxymethyltransferase [Candidatus Roizmanbacteria bacterium]